MIEARGVVFLAWVSSALVYLLLFLRLLPAHLERRKKRKKKHHTEHVVRVGCRRCEEESLRYMETLGIMNDIFDED